MKQIIALQEYTDKYISLYEGQIRNIQNSIADKLIQQGVVAEHGDQEEKEEEKSIEDVFLTVTITETPGATTTYTCDLTCDDIKNYFKNKYPSMNNYFTIVQPILIEHKISSSPTTVQKYLGSISVTISPVGEVTLYYTQIFSSSDSINITRKKFHISTTNTITYNAIFKSIK